MFFSITFHRKFKKLKNVQNLSNVHKKDKPRQKPIWYIKIQFGLQHSEYITQAFCFTAFNNFLYRKLTKTISRNTIHRIFLSNHDLIDYPISIRPNSILRISASPPAYPQTTLFHPACIVRGREAQLMCAEYKGRIVRIVGSSFELTKTNGFAVDTIKYNTNQSAQLEMNSCDTGEVIKIQQIDNQRPLLFDYNRLEEF